MIQLDQRAYCNRTKAAAEEVERGHCGTSRVGKYEGLEDSMKLLSIHVKSQTTSTPSMGLAIPFTKIAIDQAIRQCQRSIQDLEQDSPGRGGHQHRKTLRILTSLEAVERPATSGGETTQSCP